MQTEDAVGRHRHKVIESSVVTAHINVSDREVKPTRGEPVKTGERRAEPMQPQRVLSNEGARWMWEPGQGMAARGL